MAKSKRGDINRWLAEVVYKSKGKRAERLLEDARQEDKKTERKVRRQKRHLKKKREAM